jgi:hypothetical protein
MIAGDMTKNTPYLYNRYITFGRRLCYGNFAALIHNWFILIFNFC